MNGERLRELRMARGLTRKQLELETGVDRQTLARFECYPPDNPKIRDVLKLAQYFGVDVAELMG